MIYSEALKYLTEIRKITPETIQEHNIAFCNKQGFLYAGTNYPVDFTKLEETYFNCIIFPIYDLYGEPIAIMSRRMYETKRKYVNSSASNIFTKGKHLYGLDKAWPYILKQNQVIVVEGNFDCITLQQYGIKNTVAMLGTALTDTQVALLSRFTDNIVLITDRDEAGDRAGKKYQKIVGKHVTCRHHPLPTKLDPDEFIIQKGVDVFREHLNTI